jgi:hypothetical protein
MSANALGGTLVAVALIESVGARSEGKGAEVDHDVE